MVMWVIGRGVVRDGGIVGDKGGGDVVMSEKL